MFLWDESIPIEWPELHIDIPMHSFIPWTDGQPVGKVTNNDLPTFFAPKPDKQGFYDEKHRTFVANIGGETFQINLQEFLTYVALRDYRREHKLEPEGEAHNNLDWKIENMADRPSIEITIKACIPIDKIDQMHGLSSVRAPVIAPPKPRKKHKRVNERLVHIELSGSPIEE